MNYKIVENRLTNSNEIILCLGFFDGMHLGHQELIKETIKLANLSQVNSGLLTFDHLPNTKVKKRDIKKVLSSKEDKLIPSLDKIIFLKFDNICKNTSKEDFIKFLINDLNCVGVVVGEDYRFGLNGEGDASYLKSLNCDNFKVSVVRPLKIDNEIISTTLIINYLQNGNIERANKFLGRPYSLKGKVIEGFHLGNTLSFPTANIKIDENLVIPKFGVYAVNIEIEGEQNIYKGVANLGIRPSVNTLSSPLLEVHFLDFDGNLYQKVIKVSFIYYLREERKFNSLEELKTQVINDKKKVLELLK